MSFARPRHRVRLAPRGASRTEQHWKPLTSIDNMVKRYISGDKSVVRNCHFADVSELPEDLHHFLQFNFNVAEVFDSLGDSVKSKFATPSELLAALEDRSNLELMRAVGLIDTPVTPDKGALRHEEPSAPNT